MSMKLFCNDLPESAGPLVAFPGGLRRVDADAAEALAQNGMMLALAPEHAERLIANGEREATRAGASPAQARA
jgi:hypothetical protein